MGAALVEVVNIVVAATVSAIVLLIFASDRLDGDELWKGAIVGPAVVGACTFARSHTAQRMLASLAERFLPLKRDQSDDVR